MCVWHVRGREREEHIRIKDFFVFNRLFFFTNEVSGRARDKKTIQSGARTREGYQFTATHVYEAIEYNVK